jgi:hypothetical protein
MIFYFYIYVHMDSFQSKEKPEVDTILTANFYFLKCKLEKNCEKTELARKYLTSLINKALNDRSENKLQSIK